MKTEILLEKLTALKPHIAMNGVSKPIFDQLIAEVESDLRRETAAAAGAGSAHKTITKILNGLKNEPRESLRYAWIDSNDRQCICDGYRAFRLKNHLPLPKRPDNVGDPLDLDKIFPKNLNAYLSIPLPSAADVKTYIAAWKAEHDSRREDCIYHFGAGLPSVNAKYLLDLVSVFPSCNEIKYNGIINPMYCSCESGDALLLPVRSVSNGIDAEKNNAALMLHNLMIGYKESVEKDPRYSLTPEQFAEMADLLKIIQAA